MKKTNILIVEDEGAVTLYIKTLLEDHGYSVTNIVMTGEEALADIQKTPPDLVLMDILLSGGGMDGTRTASRIREQFDIPVVYLTACSDMSTVENARKTAPYGYIVKPFEPRELLTVIALAFERRAMERELRASEEKYRVLVENINIGVCQSIYDEAEGVQGRYVYVNPALAKIFGFASVDEFMKVPIGEFYDNQEDRQGIIEELRQKDLIKARIVRVRKKDGTPVWISLSAILQTEQPGRKILYGVFEDITEQREMEEQLHESEERFRQIFDQEQDALIMFHCEAGKIVDLNTTALQLYGYAKQELMGGTLAVLMDNAAHAIAKEGTIAIKTWCENNLSVLLYPIQAAAFLKKISSGYLSRFLPPRRSAKEPAWD